MCLRVLRNCQPRVPNLRVQVSSRHQQRDRLNRQLNYPAASEAVLLVDETPPAPQDALLDRVPVESSSSPSLPISSSESSSPIALHDAEPTSLSLTHEEMSSTAGASLGFGAGRGLFADTASTLRTRFRTRLPAWLKRVHPPSIGRVHSRCRVPHRMFFLLPLPWEQVQETTIAIPQPDVERLLSSVSVVWRPSWAVSPEVSSSSRVHSQGD